MSETPLSSKPGRSFSILALILILAGFGIEIAGVVTNNSNLFMGGVFVFAIALTLFAVSWWLGRK